MGRKSINIDPDQVRALARLSCSYEEIADVLKIGRSTFAKKLKEKTIREAYERGKSEGAVSLKRAQFDTAVSGNTAMLIWLGKNRLGQADRIETKNETEITATGALDKLNNSIARIVERKRQD
tara:strand:- start:2251 stop:2619 length:369 start_codon:yes stop_codon:yes gene_type:complete